MTALNFRESDITATLKGVFWIRNATAMPDVFYTDKLYPI